MAPEIINEMVTMFTEGTGNNAVHNSWGKVWHYPCWRVCMRMWSEVWSLPFV